MKTKLSLLFYLKKPRNYQTGPMTIYLRITVESRKIVNIGLGNGWMSLDPAGPARKASPTGIYKMKLYLWMTLIFIAGYALVNISVRYFEPGIAIIGFLLFLIGLPLYYLLRKVFVRLSPPL